MEKYPLSPMLSSLPEAGGHFARYFEMGSEASLVRRPDRSDLQRFVSRRRANARLSRNSDPVSWQDIGSRHRELRSSAHRTITEPQGSARLSAIRHLPSPGAQFQRPHLARHAVGRDFPRRRWVGGDRTIGDVGQEHKVASSRSMYPPHRQFGECIYAFTASPNRTADMRFVRRPEHSSRAETCARTISNG